MMELQLLLQLQLQLQLQPANELLLTFPLWGQPHDPSNHCQTVNSLILC